MTDHILVPVDGSEIAYNAVTYACQLFPHARLTIGHVIDPTQEWEEGPPDADTWKTRAQSRGERITETATKRAEDAGIQPNITIVWGKPHRAIQKLVEEIGVQHIVMGGTGASMQGRTSLGGVAETVVRRASVPVTLTQFSGSKDISSPERILTAVDGSELSLASLEYALNQFPDAEHRVVSVCEFDFDPSEVAGTYVQDRVETEEAWAEEVIAEATEIATQKGVDIETVIRFGRPVHTIIDLVEEADIDHTIVGTRGQSRTRSILLGSVAEGVARRAPTPVTVYR